MDKVCYTDVGEWGGGGLKKLGFHHQRGSGSIIIPGFDAIVWVEFVGSLFVLCFKRFFPG